MEKILLSFFENNNIDLNNKKFVLAVSTGIDSAVLLAAFINLKKENNFDLVIAHVNHHMRKQSDIEASYIKDYSERNNIACFIKDLYFDDINENFEALARKKRYEFFFKVMDEVKGDYLVLAHHGNDSIETILMRIIRGSSLEGYGGMQEITNMNGYVVLRPLLNNGRVEIEDYQKNNHIVYFEDETNQEMAYTRNRIRKDIIPKMFEESSDLINKFSEFRKTIYEASKIVDSVRDEFINENVSLISGNIVIDRDAYLTLNNFLKEEVLFEILFKYNLSKKHINELMKIIQSDLKNYNHKFKEQFSFIIEYHKIIITEKDYLLSNEEITIDKPGTYYLGDKKIICVLQKNDKKDYNLNEMWYNTNMLPVVIRHRKNGDRIVLNGKSKKLKNLFIDMKLSLKKRNNAILCLKDNEVLMVFGIKKSDALKNMNDLQQNVKITVLEEKNG